MLTADKVLGCSASLRRRFSVCDGYLQCVSRVHGTEQDSPNCLFLLLHYVVPFISLVIHLLLGSANVGTLLCMHTYHLVEMRENLWRPPLFIDVYSL